MSDGKRLRNGRWERPKVCGSLEKTGICGGSTSISECKTDRVELTVTGPNLSKRAFCSGDVTTRSEEMGTIPCRYWWNPHRSVPATHLWRSERLRSGKVNEQRFNRGAYTHVWPTTIKKETRTDPFRFGGQLFEFLKLIEVFGFVKEL